MSKNFYLNLLVLAALATASTQVRAQGVGIGIATPAASAMLDVTSTTKGLLPPRMTKAQRDAIATPASGLLITQTDNTPGLYQYLTGLGWVSVGTLNSESLATLAAPTTAVNLTPATTTVVYTTNNSGTIGSVTLQPGTEGQRLVIINNDAEYLPVISTSGTGNILPRYGARYIYTSGAWRRES
jgi:hypothetical protein